ncbi:MAG: type VI secretion system baseplate subunit TssK [Pseudomonadota bacterium]
MTSKNKVLWTEGLFLRPQHFQQHDRYLEGLVESRCRDLHNHSWGFSELTLDTDQLTIGKIAISQARGVFPDGTPFSIPDVDRAPAPIDIDESVRDCRIYLALPVRQEGETEYSESVAAEGMARFVSQDVKVRDASDYANSGSASDADMRVGDLRTRLLPHTQQRDDYACIAVTHVVEAKADRSVTVDPRFVPPVLDVRAAGVLDRFASELQGMLHHRGQALAGRVTASGQGGAAEIADFLLLQAVNRYEPLAAHLAALNGLHPEELFRELLQMAGDLCTFSSAQRRPPEFPPYRHDELATSFEPLMQNLRESLGTVIEQRAVPIPLQEPRYGIRVGLLQDRTLLGAADFVLAVRADVPSEDLRAQFPPQAKIGSVETIKRMIESGIPGIRVTPLPVAPRQIPYHADFVYFQLDNSSEFWAELQQSGGFAIYVATEFPGIDMQFWAIRQ